MKTIRKHRNGFAVLFAGGILFAVFFSIRHMTEAAFVFGAISIALLIALIRQSRLLYDASLIWDNRIIAVSQAVITLSDGSIIKGIDETVVSTFGILIGTKICKWGSRGIYGAQLNAINIDRSHIYLTFGDGCDITRAKLLHGLTDEQAVLDVKQRFQHETGVTGTTCGW